MNEALDQDLGEYDEPNLTEDELLDLALDNARICVENGSGAGGWPDAYLRDVATLRAERARARSAAVALEQQLAEVQILADKALAALLITARMSTGATLFDLGHLRRDLLDIQRVLGAGDD